ncbi:uncharacterized protein TrAtP1_002781 [Trichoderma atroviride]|uniref:uncharacterized protein n=1 Tax=Hypocrea atroviridis TaxID=63577 RepID=UPI00331EA8E5|nr:hypothetical protein TrAtP1_002781 [Trichoderma atroviride]
MFAPKNGKLDAKHSLSCFYLISISFSVYACSVYSILINPVSKIGQKDDEAAKALRRSRGSIRHRYRQSAPVWACQQRQWPSSDPLRLNSVSDESARQKSIQKLN